MAYFSLTPRDKVEMCEVIGVANPQELFDDIPSDLRFKGELGLGEPLSELEVRRLMSRLAAKNLHADANPSFLGAGSYDHYVPTAVPALALRGEFATAYTPYQAETSQGTLQVIYEFQTLLCQLSGMEMANASLYDGATALAEAVIMATAITKRKKVLIPRAVSPNYRQVVEAYTQGLPIELVEVGYEDGLTPLSKIEALLDSETAAVVIAQPNFFGGIEDVEAISAAAKAKGALLVSVFNPISVGLLPAPGEYGADIAVAEGQPLGIASSFGGPGVGLFCCKKQYARLAPGRLAGTTVDSQGRPGFTLTLQTREQHIRREKATSNICTNQALCALFATIYLALLGPKGINGVAEQSYHKAHYAASALEAAGVKRLFGSDFFHEWVIQTNEPAAVVNQKLAAQGIIGGLDLSTVYPELQNALLLCCTEKRTKTEIDQLVEALTS